MKVTQTCLLLTTILCSPLVLATSGLRNPSKEISAISNPIIHTPNHRISAYSKFQLSFIAYRNRKIKLHLEPNHDIIQPEAHVQYLDNNGQVTHAVPIDRMKHKVFLGDVWLQNLDHSYSRVGHARIFVHDDGAHPIFEGSFDIHHDYHHIQMHKHYRQTKHPNDPQSDFPDEQMIIWRDSDLKPDIPKTDELRKRFAADKHVSGSCLSDELDFNLNLQHPIYVAMPTKQMNSVFPWAGSLSNILGKRQIDTGTGSGNSAGVNLASTVGNPAGCPTTRKVALVGVATDCTYTAAFANNSAVQNNVIAVMNSASNVYESTLNISLGLQNITISPSSCPGSPIPATPWNQACTADIQIQDRLNLFSAWRSQQHDSNSHWTLMSTCATGTAVGLAWLGQACVIDPDARNSTSGEQTVSGANVVVRTSGTSEWQILAHETGHTFGAVHDCTSQTCTDGTVTLQQCCPLSPGSCDAGEKYIMNPSTSQGITNFSPCSLGNICSAFRTQSVKTTCFSQNKGVPLLTGAVCGNGIVEQGEDCDCGGSDACNSDGCCDGATCKFKQGAVCDPTNDECCNGCQYAASGTVCRASTGSCDPEEVCSGSGPTCPPDVVSPAGQSCGTGLTCASGQCTSRDAQCKSLMGPYLNGNNDTSACDEETCVLSCASPEFGPDTCYGLQQNFLDGTPCGGGGQCLNGACKGSNVGKEIKNWISEHKSAAIAIGVSLGVFILLALLSCIYRCYRRRTRATRGAVPWPRRTKYHPNNNSSTNGFYAQGEQQQRQQQQQPWHEQAQQGPRPPSWRDSWGGMWQAPQQPPPPHPGFFQPPFAANAQAQAHIQTPPPLSTSEMAHNR